MLEHNRILNRIDRDPCSTEPSPPDTEPGLSDPASTKGSTEPLGGERDSADKEQEREEEHERSMGMYRRILCLYHVDRCGMCGTTRHATKPYFNLGTRLCKFCLQDNLVSDLALEERYWINVGSREPVDGCKGSASFADKIVDRVWFFREYVTAKQLCEYTRDPVDFMDKQGKKNRNMWFFWRPHLESILDLPALAEEAKAKHKSASIIRAITRRTITLRTLNGTALDRSKPTRLVQWEKKRDRRPAKFKLERSELVSQTMPLMVYCWKTSVERRLGNFEDRVRPPRPLTTKQRALSWAEAALKK